MKTLSCFVIAAVFVCISLVAVAAYADMGENVADGAVGIAEKSNDCMGKLTRGVANVALGWAEFPKMCMSKEGPVEGINRAMTRTGGGMMDIFTSPMPPYDETYIEPEYFSP